MDIEKPVSEAEIDELEEFLISDAAPEGALNISSLHGFLTALAACPSLTPPSQWLPAVWGKKEPVFDSEEEGERILSLMLRVYNSIIETLEKNPEEFLPILYEDYPEADSKEEPDLIAQDWCDGFSRGVAFRSVDWEPLLEDDDHRNLLAPIIAFTSPEAMADVLENAGGKVSRKTLIDFLPLSVAAIYEYWREGRRALARGLTPDPSPVRAASKLGRNDPCPCGSGKKYKQCCGAA